VRGIPGVCSQPQKAHIHRRVWGGDVVNPNIIGAPYDEKPAPRHSQRSERMLEGRIGPFPDPGAPRA